MNKNILKNKKVIISCILLLLILGSSIAFAFYQNSQKIENKNNNKEVETGASEYLYHIQYLDKEGTLSSINITKDWEIKYLTIEKAGEKTEQLQDLLKTSKYKNGLKLEEQDQKLIKDTFANIDYNLEINAKTTLREDEYKIIDYEIGKGAKKEDENPNISFIMQALANKDRKYLDILYTKEMINKVKEQQKETQLELSSMKINNLYEKTRISKEITTIPDYYKNEKFTNDSIITLTLESGVRSIEKQIHDDALREDIIYLEYDKQDFERKAKELWGPTISYNSERYNGSMHCEGYTYNKEKDIFEKHTIANCEVKEEIISEIEFAYETETELVLVEKSLYLDYGTNTKTKKAGIYNNVKENILLYEFTNEDEIENAITNGTAYLQQYSDFATYYSYTFNKSEDGSYILSNFKRLGK